MGVVGIVAAKLVDKYQRPAFVIGLDPVAGIGRGSARTRTGISLYEALAEAAQDPRTGLHRWGGHAMAAGFTVGCDQVGALAEALGVACGKLAEGSGPTATHVDVDAEVHLAEIDERLAQELTGLGPFGQNNPAPILVTRNARVTSARRVGDGKHLKLTLEDHQHTTRDAIGFGLGDRPVEVGCRLDLSFVPKVSTWQGRRNAELELSDLAILES
jgi:single-stranded-DNA-specific exonuclease